MENIVTTPSSSQAGSSIVHQTPGNVPINKGFVGDSLSSWLSSQTGSHLTGADLEANRFSAEQSQLNRDWQTEMSNTAYQRAVEDMRKAGLNPALLFGSGSQSSTPSGSSPSSSRGSTGLSLSELLALGKVKSEIKLLDAQASKMESESELTRKQIGSWDSEVNAKIDNLRANSDKYIADIQEVDSRIKLNTAQELLTLIEKDLRSAQIEAVKSQSQSFLADVDLKREQIRKIASDIHLNSWQERKISKELGLIGWQAKKTATEAGFVGVQSRQMSLNNELIKHQVEVLEKTGMTPSEANDVAKMIMNLLFGVGFFASKIL